MSTAPQVGSEREYTLSAYFIKRARHEGNILYVSPSVKEILGYEPHEVIGIPPFALFHPDEVAIWGVAALAVRRRQKVGVAVKMRLMHAGGVYVDCLMSASIVYNICVGRITRLSNGPIESRTLTTARDAVDLSAGMAAMSLSPLTRSPSPPLPLHVPISKPEPSSVDSVERTCYIIDRFSSVAPIMYASNDLIVKHNSPLEGRPFLDIVRREDHAKVKQWIEATKTWSPVLHDNEAQKTGGFGYLSFYVVRNTDDEIDDINHDDAYVYVEGIFEACSDGIICIISPDENEDEDPPMTPSDGQSLEGSVPPPDSIGDTLSQAGMAEFVPIPPRRQKRVERSEEWSDPEDEGAHIEKRLQASHTPQHSPPPHSHLSKASQTSHQARRSHRDQPKEAHGWRAQHDSMGVDSNYWTPTLPSLHALLAQPESNTYRDSSVAYRPNAPEPLPRKRHAGDAPVSGSTLASTSSGAGAGAGLSTSPADVLSSSWSSDRSVGRAPHPRRSGEYAEK